MIFALVLRGRQVRCRGRRIHHGLSGCFLVGFGATLTLLGVSWGRRLLLAGMACMVDDIADWPWGCA